MTKPRPSSVEEEQGYSFQLVDGIARLGMVDRRLHAAETELFDHELAVLEAEAVRDLVAAETFAAMTGPHLDQIRLLEARCRALGGLRDQVGG